MVSAGSFFHPMLDAIQPLLAEQWSRARVYAQSEALKMATTLETVARLRQRGHIDDHQAIALIDLQRHAAQAVFLSMEGIGLTTAQHAVNAFLGAVKERFNGTVPSPLL